MVVNNLAKVLIVGAGPTGLMAAIELLRRGISCRIVDRLCAPSELSKALLIHTRTLELLKFTGIADEMISHGTLCHGATLFANEKRLIHLSFNELESPYPYVLCVPQAATEAVLAKYLRKYNGEVERGIEVTGFSQSAQQVSVSLKHYDGILESAQFDYVIGCDGAHSTIRQQLPFTFDGADYPQTFALADVAIKWNHHDDEVTTFFFDDGAIACFPMGNGRVRLMLDFLNPPDDSSVPRLSEIQSLCDKHIVDGATISDPAWLTYFKIHRRSSSGYRKERVFLAGDAAHIHNPIGGQGMNTGMHDACNLAWKLALVINGDGTEELLDSYEQERQHVAKALLSGTDLATKVATIKNPIGQSIRNSLGPLLMSMDVIQQRMLNAGSMLSVNYRHSHVVGEHRSGIRLDSQLTSSVEFAHGPLPGDRAVDGHLSLKGQGVTLFDLFSETTGYKLLLFPGLSKLAGSHERLVEIASKTQEQYQTLIKPYLIIGNQQDAQLIESVEALEDSDGVVHHKYGAAGDCFYLIRPDGYVGYRAQPPDWAFLEQHLKRLLKRQAVTSPT